MYTAISLVPSQQTLKSLFIFVFVGSLLKSFFNYSLHLIFCISKLNTLSCVCALAMVNGASVNIFAWPGVSASLIISSE